MCKVVLKAPLVDDSGYAQWGRGLLRALREAVSGSYSLQVIPMAWAANSLVADLDRTEIFEDTLPPDTPLASGDILIHLTLPQEYKPARGVWNIGVFTFEASRISHEWAAACNTMDEIWVPAQFVKEAAILSGVSVPIQVIPIGCTPSKAIGSFDALDAIETPFNFLCVGQWLPGEIGADRKNIGLTLQLFYDTFRGNPNVGLVLKTFAATQSTTDRFDIIRKVRTIWKSCGSPEFPRVYLLHGRLTAQEMQQLYRHSKVKALVSLSHGEGWWNEGAEAAVAGLPIIATGYGAHTEYLKPSTSALIPYSIAPVSLRWPGVYEPSYMFWGQPDVAAASRLMRRCYEKYDIAVEKAKEQQEAMSGWTWSSIVPRLRARLLEIKNTHNGES